MPGTKPQLRSALQARLQAQSQMGSAGDVHIPGSQVEVAQPGSVLPASVPPSVELSQQTVRSVSWFIRASSFLMVNPSRATR